MLAVSAGYVEHIALLVGLGVCTGVLSGLLGIGGGVVIVPALFVVFSGMGLPHHSLMHYAVGTSLGVMVISASSAVSFHLKHVRPNWRLVLMLCPVVCLGVLLGASLAHVLPTHWLQRLFALLLIVVAYKLFLGKKLSDQLEPVSALSFASAGPLGTFVGFCSGLLGIGGGVIVVPFLLHKHFAYRHAVVISLLMSVTGAVTGVLLYMILGHLRAHVPQPGFIGNVYVVGALLVAMGAIPGTWIASKVMVYCPIPMLKKIFACLLLLTCMHMVYSSFH